MMRDLKPIIREFIDKIWKIFLIMIPIGYVIGYVHEIGHYLVGTYQNSTCIIHWRLTTHCDPDPNNMWYWGMGGIFGIVVSSIPLISAKVRKSEKLSIILVTMLSLQILNFSFETFLHSEYFTVLVNDIMNGLTIMIFLFLCVRSTVQTKNKT